MTAIGSAGAMRTAFAGLTVIAAVLLTGAIGVSPAAAAPPGEIKLDVVTVNGSGCPAGTTSVRMSPDNTSFHISYDNFTASGSGGATSTSIRKACQVGVLVHVPQGFTFAVASAAYKGWASIARGATALQKNTYYFQGESANALPPTEHTFYGTYNGVWQTRDSEPVVDYSPCGRDIILNVKSELRVTSTTSASSTITLSGSSGDVDTLVQFNWKAC